MCTYTCMCVYVCVNIYIYIYIYIHRLADCGVRKYYVSCAGYAIVSTTYVSNTD